MDKREIIWRPDNHSSREQSSKNDKLSEQNEIQTHSTIWKQGPTKREKHSDNLSNRIPMCQASVNPFVSGSYLEHLDHEASFLRPRNSNYGE